METLFGDGRFKPIKNDRGEKKAESYGWNTDFGKRGKFCLLSKAELRIDSSYQRGQSKHKAQRIAREFLWFAFGIVIVSRRANGSLFVLDGGHRTLTAMMRPEIDVIPCLVFDGLSKEQEAKAFIYYNANRKAPTGIELFAADVVAKDPIAIGVNAIARKFDIHIENNNRDVNACRAPRMLMEIYKKDEGETLPDVLQFVNDVWGGNPKRLSQVVLYGVAKFGDAYKSVLGYGILENGCRDAFKRADLSVLLQRSNGIRELSGKNKQDSFKAAMIQHWNKKRTKSCLPI